MEKKLLRILQIADELNNKQDKVFAEIEYTADNKKKLQILIRSKEDFSYIEIYEKKVKFIYYEIGDGIAVFEILN